MATRTTGTNLLDLELIIRECQNLPKMDLVGHADPFTTLRLFSPDDRLEVCHSTAIVHNTPRPVWNEEVNLRNVPMGSRLAFEVWDKDTLTTDDFIGTCSITLDAETVAAAAAAAALGSASPERPGGLVRAVGSVAAFPYTTGRRLTLCPCRTVDDVESPGLSARSAPMVLMTGPSISSSVGNAPSSVLRLPIKAPNEKRAGVLILELRCRPSSSRSGPVMHFGPVRYRMSMSALAGVLANHTRDDWRAKLFAAYELALTGVLQFFPRGATVHWNTHYYKARQVFANPFVKGGIKVQHALLYRDSRNQSRLDGPGNDTNPPTPQPPQPHSHSQRPLRGLLRGGGDLVRLLHGGVRDRARRYFTYTILGDGRWCFSETGASFFTDFMSKHAMHADCAEKVIYAGEFCLVPPIELQPPRQPSPPGPVVSQRSDVPPPLLSRASRITSPSRDVFLEPAGPSSGAFAPVSAPPSPASSAASAPDGAKLTSAEAAAEAAAALAALGGVGGCEARGWRLVLDNNSGTYAPPKEQLPQVAAFLAHNFPGLKVEALEVGDPQLKLLHARIPSRVPGK